MAKIVRLQEAKPVIFKIGRQKRRVVLVGGCFDILHIGHVNFLSRAKKEGDLLVVLLENDSNVKKLKGNNHPIFNQQERALVLSSLSIVDYIFLLPNNLHDSDYDKLVSEIKPCIIAATENDPLIDKKKKQVEEAGGKLIIIPYLKTFSSSRLANILGLI